MPTTFTEQARQAAHLVSEASGYRSRDAIIVGTAANLAAGTVLGRVTATGKYLILAPAAGDGTQTAAAILYGPALAATADVPSTANTRDCEVNGNLLTWPVGITGPQKTAALASLAAVGILVRT
jgi:hypothetical protein